MTKPESRLDIAEAPVTDLVTECAIPFEPNMDWCNFYGWFTGDSKDNFYRVKLESLDKSGNVMTSAWVEECYVPPMSETVYIPLPKGAVDVRCTISGPEPGVHIVWRDAKLIFWIERPTLSIQRFKDFVYFSTDDRSNAYTLEKYNGLNWEFAEQPAYCRYGSGIFRLRRNLKLLDVVAPVIGDTPPHPK